MPSLDVAVATVGLVGARGYVGRELTTLIDAHPKLDLAWASSREGGAGFVEMTPERLADHPVDVVVLALPDGHAARYAAALEGSCLVIDLSADHRYDDGWTYGLPEHERDSLARATRIANPGCYATAMQLVLRPLADRIAQAHVFGVSGYSGAGSKPSHRNDPERLADGVLPYRSTNHGHEREVSHRLGRQIRFLPHVAPFFRGLIVTASIELHEPTTPGALCACYEAAYEAEPLIDPIGVDVPLVRQIAGRDGAVVGGVSVDRDDPRRVAVVGALDNLRKGAATQALQNINIALGHDEYQGLER